ncbi:Di-and tricarboxylate transporter [Planctomycetales bacterium 10988]|nr:Di-and tricarboxylate transporter [Planctomycetales bacterium 10988]
MIWEPWCTLGIVLIAFWLLQSRNAPPDLVFLLALILVTMLGILDVEEALAGFANPAVIVIGALFVVAAAMRSTGALDWLGEMILGKAHDEKSALRRLSIPVIFLSALINNTPIVAMLVPMILRWCRQRKVSPSRILLPLSYLAILGGTCTLIGTSTNLVVNGLLLAEQARLQTVNAAPELMHDLRDMHFLEIGFVGIPCALVGLIYLLTWGRKLLPNRVELMERLGEERREYLVEMMVQPDCRLIGKTVEDAGLRHLPGLFLIEIDRDGEVITPVTPQDVIHESDHLIFTGVVSTIVDLEKIQGLTPVADLSYELNPKARSRRHLSEAVISSSSPLIGKTIRAANFRTNYSAAVVAVHRNGHRLEGKIGDVILKPGDTLLLQTRTHFADSFRDSSDFYLVSSVEGSRQGRHDRIVVAFILLGLLVVGLTLSSFYWLFPEGSPFTSPSILSLAVAGLMIAFRCIPLKEARAAIDLQVLLTIAAALGLGKAMQQSGAVELIASGVVNSIGPHHPFFLLIFIYLITLIFTEMVTNNAVAALMFPLAVAIAIEGDLSPRPFVMAIALAASCSFITPIGYQTNLMVMGPGSYRPSDYFRIGWPLSLLIMITATTLIPWVWPFH